MIIDILEIVLIVVIAVTYLVYVYRTQGKFNLNEWEEWKMLWAEVAVKWAEDRLKGEDGESKRKAAIGALTETLKDMGAADVPEDQIKMLISAAYFDKIGWIGEWRDDK